MTYFKQIINELSLTQNNLPKGLRPKGQANEVQSSDDANYPLLSEDQKNNLLIHYYRLDGAPYNYKKTGSRWRASYTRTRFKPGNEPTGGDGKPIKYLSPKGSGQLPYFTPGILAAYQARKQIGTLYLVEGEKKALAGYLNGLMIVGLPSIHGFYGQDNTNNSLKTMHPDLLDLLHACKVKKVVYITDADTLTLNYSKDKDMAKRPTAFYSAVRNFRSTLAYELKNPDTELAEIYFVHIRNSWQRDAKGLDDLLHFCKKDKKAVIRDLQKHHKAAKYFEGLDITDNYAHSLLKYFGLNKAENFYKTYAFDLQDKPFLYRNAKYVWNGEELIFLHHGDTEKYLRIGPDWMKIIDVPNKYGEPESNIIKWNISEIERDYKRFPGFTQGIKKYDAFCNEPNWNGAYKREHYNCFNLANPLPHEARPGAWPTIYNFLKHIFRGDGAITFLPGNYPIECAMDSDIFTVGMDYLTIMLRFPKQPLPVPVLVSPENNTGKSTFLKFLQALYGSNNVAILNNDQFKMKFNAHYITKFIIAIDESFLDVDKKAEKERLKQLVTADTAFLENKGMDLKKFPYHGKVIMASNDADSVMKMEDEEDRWFVTRVPTVPSNMKDPDLEQKMKKEIPAFLDYLHKRKIWHPRKDRLWFEPRHYLTEQFKKIVSETKDYITRQIDSFIQELMLDYQLAEIKMDAATLHEYINKRSKYKINANDIREKLKRSYNLSPQPKPQKFSYPIGYVDNFSGEHEIQYSTKTGRYYTFQAEHFLPDGLTVQSENESDVW